MGNSHTSDEALPVQAETLVNEAISTYPVVMFSKTYCPYCVSAKSHISSAGEQVDGFQPVKVFELNLMGKLGRAVQSHLANKTGRSTVPNVFIGGKPVGGGDEIQGYFNRGVLAQMLTQAPERLSYLKSKNVNDAAPDADEPDSEKADSETPVQTYVDDLIKSNPVMVFSKTYCPFCKRAKAILQSAIESVDGHVPANILELDTMGERGSKIQQYLLQKTGQRTVPNVFINGEHIGGCDTVSSLEQTGQLTEKLQSAFKPQTEDGVEQNGNVVTDEEAPVEAFVEEAAQSNAVTVFSKTYCPYSRKAKSVLESTGESISSYIPAHVVELDTMGERGSAIQEFLLEKTGQRTVPNVFINGAHIGGCDSILSLEESGDLKEKLKAAYAAKSSSSAETENLEREDVEKSEENVKVAVFGAGCFWGVELAFQRVDGVLQTEVGYSNGMSDRLTYEEVCSGDTDAAEVVKVTYDSDVVSFRKLLDVWESRHDPTSLNKQGNDEGTQYRSALYVTDADQKEEVLAWKEEAEQRLGSDIVTDIAEVNNYCPAEEYHQRYLEKKGQNAAKGASERIRCYG